MGLPTRPGKAMHSFNQTTMQAMATCAAWLRAVLSKRVARLLNGLNRAKAFSMACLPRERTASKAAGCFRQGWGGMTASAPMAATAFRTGLPS